MSRTFCVVFFLLICLRGLFAQEDSDESEDTSAGLPASYADYLVASSTLSPDKKLAVIYPKVDLCSEEPKEGADNRCQDYLVALQPFQILTKLDTKWPVFQNESHGGMHATWSKEGSAVLVTLEGKWGPRDIFLYEIRDGRLARSTNLLKKIHDLMLPDYKKTKPEPYNEYFDFIFETTEPPLCEFADSTHVRIRGSATTDPKEMSGTKAWAGKIQAIWDIPKAKFTSQKVTRTFAGVRKGEAR